MPPHGLPRRRTLRSLPERHRKPSAHAPHFECGGPFPCPSGLNQRNRPSLSHSSCADTDSVGRQYTAKGSVSLLGIRCVFKVYSHPYEARTKSEIIRVRTLVL